MASTIDIDDDGPVNSMALDDDDDLQIVSKPVVAKPEKDIVPVQSVFTDIQTGDDDDGEVVIVFEQPLTASVRVSAIQAAVARAGLALDAKDARAVLLFDVSAPALAASPLDSIWSETAKTLHVGRIAQNLPVAPAVQTPTARTRSPYDANIALIHEYTSPFLYNERTSYEQGDEFGVGDTFTFARTRPDTAESEPRDWRDYQHRFSFSPNRYDTALTLQPISALLMRSNPNGRDPLRSVSKGLWGVARQLNSRSTRSLFDALVSAFDNQSMLVPGLFVALDHQRSAEMVGVPSALLPLSTGEAATKLTAYRDTIDAPRYSQLESRGSFDLSRRLVLASAELAAATRSELQTTDMALIPDGLFDEFKDTKLLALDEATAARDHKQQRLAALAQIEQLLAEKDGSAYGMLRQQSLNVNHHGPFFVVDDLREYNMREPALSVARALGQSKPGDAIFEQRLQRHSRQPLSRGFRPNSTYSERLRRAVRHAEKPELSDDESEPVDDAVDDDDASEIDGNVSSQQLGDALNEVLDADAGGEDVKRKRDEVPAVPAVVEEVPGDGPLTAAAVEEIKQEKRRRLQRRAPSDDAERPESDDAALIFSEARLVTLLSRAGAKKRKTDENDDGDNDDDDEIRLLKQQFREEAAREREQEKDAVDLGVDYEDVDDYDVELAQGEPIVEDSPALFGVTTRSGYFGPVIGVPSSATQRRLLETIERESKNGWRRAARPILLAAIYFKLVPRLYTDQFPAEAVDWLLATLRLLRERINVAHELFQRNISATRARVVRTARIKTEDMPEDEAEEAAEDEEEVTMTTAILPSVLVVDIENTIGRVADMSVPISADGPSVRDILTTAVIYATHKLRPQSLADPMQTVELEREVDELLATESYPTLDTFGASGETVTNMLDLVSIDGLRRVEDRASRLFQKRGKGLAATYAEELDEGVFAPHRELALAIYPELEEGLRNTVEFIYLPPPPTANSLVTLDIIARAGEAFSVLHDEAGALNTAQLVDLASARVRDRRTVAEALLLDNCALQTYVSAAQHYANENFPPTKTTAELLFGSRQPAEPFGVWRNNKISVPETTRALLSSEWLGRGRIFADTLPVIDGDDGSDEPKLFLRFFTPSRCLDVITRLLSLLQRDRPDRLATILQDAQKNINGILEDSGSRAYDQTFVFVGQLYTAALNDLERGLVQLLPTRRVVQLNAANDNLSDLIEATMRDFVENRTLTYARIPNARRVTQPFPGINCAVPAPVESPTDVDGEDDDDDDDDEDDDTSAGGADKPEPVLPTPGRADETSGLLAEVWYSSARRLHWAQLGYLATPSNYTKPLPLAPTTVTWRHESFEHIYRQLSRVQQPGVSELQFQIAREAGLVQQGRTLWFEEAMIHTDPDGFAELVVIELVQLHDWLRAQQRIVTIDYRAALPELSVASDTERVSLVADDRFEGRETVRTLDPRNANTTAAARALGNNLPAKGGNVRVDRPFGNHKEHTERMLELAQQLNKALNPARPFPTRVYRTPQARRSDVAALLNYTVRALAEPDFNEIVQSIVQPGYSAKTPNEWLEDINAVRAELQSVRQRMAERREQKRATRPTEEQAALNKVVQRARALGFTTDGLISSNSTATNAALTRLEALMDEKLDARDAEIDSVLTIARSLAGQGEMTESAVMGSLYGRLSENTLGDIPLVAAYKELLRAVAQGEKYEAEQIIAEELEGNPIFRGRIVDSLASLRSAIADYRNLVSDANDEIEEDDDDEIEEDDDDDAEEDIDPDDYRAVLTALKERYEIDLDRSLLAQALASQNLLDVVALPNQRNGIQRAFIHLLLPAAIERARIQRSQLMGRAPQYQFAGAIDVPQALRVNEIVRAYCLYGQVPVAADERNVFGDYQALLAQSGTTRVALTDRTADTPLVDESKSSLPTAVASRRAFVEQRFALDNALHHRLPFGADLQLSALWVRLMKLYGEARREPQSLAAVYVESNGEERLPLLAEVAALPRAIDRIRIYLSLVCGIGNTALRRIVEPSLGSRFLVDHLKDATSYMPAIEHMRPVDARLLVSLISGYDYSPLIKRSDEFSLESKDADDELDDAEDDGRPQTQVLDEDYIFRRGNAAKTVLIDVYYRAVLEMTFHVTQKEAASLQASKDQVVVLLRSVVARAGTQRTNPVDVYASFIEPSRFGQDLSGPPIIRVVMLRAQYESMEANAKGSYYTRERTLALYTRFVRDERTNTKEKRVVRGTSVVSTLYRPWVFEPVGDVQTKSMAEQIASLTAGAGFSATVRSLFSVVARNRIFDVAQRNAADDDAARERTKELTRQRIVITHRELAFYLIPRSALVFALYRIASIEPSLAPMIIGALETISIKLDNAAHLWHNDVVARPSALERITTTDGFADDMPRGDVLLPEQAPLVSVDSIAVDENVNSSSLLAIEASDNTDVVGWRRSIEETLSTLLGSPATLDGDVARPQGNGQRLLNYEIEAISGQLSTSADFVLNVLDPVLLRLEQFFAQRADPGGSSTKFSETAVASMRAFETSEALAAFGGDVGAVTLYWLLAQTEAKRRERWRVLVTQDSDDLRDQIAKATPSLTSDANGQRSVLIQAYAPWSALFYAAVNEVQERQTSTMTAPRAVLQAFVTKSLGSDAQALAAKRLLERTDDKGKSAPVSRADVERYVPVYALLRKFFFGAKARSVNSTLQMHPLLPLLLAAALNRTIVRIQSSPDKTSPKNLTVTTLASAIYVGADAFTEIQARDHAARSSLGAAIVLHEFVPVNTKSAKLGYVVVNHVNVSGDQTLSATLQRIVSTPPNPALQKPMIRFTD